MDAGGFQWLDRYRMIRSIPYIDLLVELHLYLVVVKLFHPLATVVGSTFDQVTI